MPVAKSWHISRRDSLARVPSDQKMKFRDSIGSEIRGSRGTQVGGKRYTCRCRTLVAPSRARARHETALSRSKAPISLEARDRFAVFARRERISEAILADPTVEIPRGTRGGAWRFNGIANNIDRTARRLAARTAGTMIVSRADESRSLGPTICATTRAMNLSRPSPLLYRRTLHVCPIDRPCAKR